MPASINHTTTTSSSRNGSCYSSINPIHNLERLILCLVERLLSYFGGDGTVLVGRASC